LEEEQAEKERRMKESSTRDSFGASRARPAIHVPRGRRIPEHFTDQSAIMKIILVQARIRGKSAFKVMEHKRRSREALRIIQSRVRGKQARLDQLNFRKATAAEIEQVALRAALKIQANFRGLQSRRRTADIKARVVYNQSLLAALHTPFLHMKSVMCTDMVQNVRIPMNCMQHLEEISEVPCIVYNTQSNQELAICDLGGDCVAKDLAIIVVGMPHVNSRTNHEKKEDTDFTPQDLSFIGEVSAMLTRKLRRVAYFEAIRTVMDQTSLLVTRRLAAGAGWGLLVEDRDTLIWYCGTDVARGRLDKLRVSRHVMPLLFRALDEEDTVHLSDVWFDEVSAPGPGRLGGGLTRGDVLMMPVRVEGRIAAIIGVDLYGAADKLTTKQSSTSPKDSFTAENREVAEQLVSKAGSCVHTLVGGSKDLGANDWSVAYLDIILKLSRQALVEVRDAGVHEIAAANSVPRKQTLVIMDALFKILDYKKPEYETLSWTGKREIFLETNMWNRMIRFHPDRWRGHYAKLELLSKGLYNMGPDTVHDTCTPAFQVVYAWLDIVVVMMAQRHALSAAFQTYKTEKEEEDPMAAIDDMKLPGQASDDEGGEDQSRPQSKGHDGGEVARRQKALSEALADMDTEYDDDFE
jgi:hypothetical protein